MKNIMININIINKYFNVYFVSVTYILNLLTNLLYSIPDYYFFASKIHWVPIIMMINYNDVSVTYILNSRTNLLYSID